MDRLFLAVLNMSLVGASIIFVIILARIALKKVPKIFSYCLWAVAGFRLIFPISIKGLFSLVPLKATPIPADIALQAVPHTDSGVSVLDNAVSSFLPAAIPAASVNPLQVWIIVGAYIWLMGVALMLVYGVASVILLKRRLCCAAAIGNNIYESGNIKTPFVLGFFRPKIYLPAGLSGDELSYIILHEQTHIRRKDHLVKIFAYLILSLHWFNPFVWAAFLLMGADMEMSCDERVISELGEAIKNTYSMSLVRTAAGRPILNGSPLAFGEGGLKERIINILNFKQPTRKKIIIAVLLVGALTAGLLFNKADRPEQAGTGAVNGINSAPAGARIFSLENPTDREKVEKLMSVSLYADGTAKLATPMISSYLLPPCSYSIRDNELLIYPQIESKTDAEFYGVKSGDVIAKFEFADAETLVFKSATIPLYAPADARYILLPNSQPEEIIGAALPKLTITTPSDTYSPFMSSMFGFKLVLKAPAEAVMFTYGCDKGSFYTYENNRIEPIGNMATTDETVYWVPFGSDEERFYDVTGMGDTLISVIALDKDGNIIAYGGAIIENSGDEGELFKFIGVLSPRLLLEVQAFFERQFGSVRPIVEIGYAEVLWQAKTKYVGDNSAVGRLLGLMPLPGDLRHNHFQLYTSGAERGLEWFLDEAENASYHVEELNQSALLLFALIDNLEDFCITTRDPFGGGIELHYDRAWAGKIVKGDIRDYVKNVEKLQELVSFLHRPPVNQ